MGDIPLIRLVAPGGCEPAYTEALPTIRQECRQACARDASQCLTESASKISNQGKGEMSMRYYTSIVKGLFTDTIKIGI